MRRLAKLISAFVFAKRIVLFLLYLNPKFQASSSCLCLCRPVCVRHVRKPHCWFSHEVAQIIDPEKTDNLGFRPGPTQTGLYSHRSRIESLNFSVKKQRNSTISTAKTKALTSCAFTAQLIGLRLWFFAYAKC